MKRMGEYLMKAEEWIAKVSLLMMVILIFSSAIARLIKHPINWAVDLSTFFFAWACFLSADVAWRKNKLMSVEIFIKLFSEKSQRIFKIINYFIISTFLVYLIIWGVQLSYTTRFRTFVGMWGFSYTWVTLSIPIGSALLLATTLVKIKKALINTQ